SSFSATSKSRSTSGSAEVSPRTVTARAPAARTPSATASAAPASRTKPTTTSWPSAASRRQVAAPIPRLPPVTTVTSRFMWLPPGDALCEITRLADRRAGPPTGFHHTERAPVPVPPVGRARGPGRAPPPSVSLAPSSEAQELAEVPQHRGDVLPGGAQQGDNAQHAHHRADGDPSPEPVVEVQRDEVLPVGLGHDGAPFSPDPGPRRSRPMLCQAPGQQGVFLIGQPEISGRPYAVSLQRSPQMDGARRAGSRPGALGGERATGGSGQAVAGDDGAAHHVGGRVTRLGGAGGAPAQLPGRGGRPRHLRADAASERPHRLRALPEGLAASPPGVRRP